MTARKSRHDKESSNTLTVFRDDNIIGEQAERLDLTCRFRMAFLDTPSTNSVFLFYASRSSAQATDLLCHDLPWCPMSQAPTDGFQRANEAFVNGPRSLTVVNPDSKSDARQYSRDDSQ